MRFFIILTLFLSTSLEALKWDYSEDAHKRLEDSQDVILKYIENEPGQDSIVPKEDRGKVFDSEKAKEDTLSGNIAPLSGFDFLKQNYDSPLISDIDQTISDNQYEIDPYTGDYIEICTESSDPIPFSVIRNLEYDLVKGKETIDIEVLKCIGHDGKKKVSRGEGNKYKKKKEKEFSRDQTIKWFHVDSRDRGIGHRDEVSWKIRHIDNCSLCDRTKTSIEPHEQETLSVANERWKYQNPELRQLADHKYSSFSSSYCLDNSAKIIGGKEYNRCWSERIDFLFNPPQVKGCDFLKTHFCKLKSSKCLKECSLGCILWERTFNCYKKLEKKNTYEISADELGLEDPVFITEYEPNNSFSEVATKLEIFRQMDSEIKDSEMLDISEFEFFSGSKMRCYVSFLKDATYDCCDKMGGLAVDGLIAKCDEDELALRDLRNRGQCVLVGKKDEHNLGIKTSTKHVFCCFSSKLAKVFNVEAKKQLGLSFGDASNPRCGGLTQDQIKVVNFDKLDLSEAFEFPEGDLEDRLERLKNKISQGIR